MKYNNVKVDTKVEWILSRLKNADGWVRRTTLENEMLSHDDFTVSKFRTAISKIESLNFVDIDTEPTEGGINDKKMYKLDSTVLEQYLDAKGEQGLERGLSSPIQSEGGSELREALVEEREERHRLESEVRELRSQLELLQSHFNARGSERIGRIEDDISYLKKSITASKIHHSATQKILEHYNAEWDKFLKEAEAEYAEYIGE
ncbi:hypothetical protein [Natrarchaeobaculum sulfurireducens]|uniref:hypothetical protein n=1 Tax=Natrarchaeobaculum sulfurireducens TaxID=2044521 RepID=UPI00105AB0BE|nr:hypothetical protein [Natrarchaeobaculum sulfurireducens]